MDEVAARPDWDAGVRERLTVLRQSLPNGAIPTELLPRELDPEFFVGSGLEGALGSWSELPFFEAETVFHFALLGVVGYREESPCDPFYELKREGLHASEPNAVTLFREAAEGLDSPREQLEVLLHASLWGNIHDLSQFHAHGHAQTMLADDSRAAVDLLLAAERVDIVLDNVGGELLADLALTDTLIQQGKRVRLHHKPRPFFVSDATRRDCLQTIRLLAEHKDGSVRAAGIRLQDASSSGDLTLETSLFWCRPLHFSKVPEGLRAKLGEADVVMVKGDLNYRRLIEDRTYPFDTPVRDIAPRGFPPLVALRVLKSEVLVGLAQGQAERLFEQSPGWMTSGDSAVLQVFGS